MKRSLMNRSGDLSFARPWRCYASAVNRLSTPL